MIDIVVLAGGRGSRSENPSFPKCLQEIEGSSLLKLLILQLKEIEIGQIILISGHMSDAVNEAFHKLMTDYLPNVDWKIISEKEPRGTWPALKSSLPLITSKTCLVLLADIYVSANFGQILNNIHPEAFTFLVHPSDHPNDSDLIRFETRTLKITEFFSKNEPRDSNKVFGNMSLVGVNVFNVQKLREIESSESELVEVTLDFGLTKGIAFCLPTSAYFKDSGTPVRLQQIRAQVRSGVSIRRGSINSPAILLDLDDTLINNVESKNESSIKNLELDLEIADEISKCNAMGLRLFVVSNQPGISKGFFTFSDFDNFRMNFEILLSNSRAYIDDFFICPHHPEGGHIGEVPWLKIDCECRKPKTALFGEISTRHGLSAKKTIFIGDHICDEYFAREVGIEFFQASCNPLKQSLGSMQTSHALIQARNQLC